MNSRSEENKPLVAVILVAYGGRDYTVACIDSLLKSDYPDLKIILVDNNSPDDTRQVIADKFPSVEILAMPKNLGFAGGNNAGIKHTISVGADFIMLLNNDTEIAFDAVSKLVDTSLSISDLGVIGPMIYYHADRNMIWSAGGVINFQWSYLRHIGIRELDRGQYGKTTDVDYLTGCALMFPAKAIDIIGYLDESFWMYYEDADFCIRLKKKGMRIVFEPKAKVWHKISSSTGGNLAQAKLKFKFRSGWQFFGRYSPSKFWQITYCLSQLWFFLRAVLRR